MVSRRKRRLFLGLGLVVALVLAVSPATASARAFAVGGGTIGSGFPPEFDLSGSHFAFSAHCKSADCSPPGSETVSGYAVLSHPVLGKAQGHVCAFQTLGGAPLFSAASFAIVVEGGSGLLASFPFLAFVVQDGVPSGPVPEDALGVFPRGECDLIGAPSAFGVPVVQGNIVVKEK